MTDGRIVHGRQLLIDEAGAANGANVGRGLAVEDGGKAGDVGLGHVLKNDVGLANAVLRPGVAGRVVGDFDGNRPSFQHAGSRP